LDPTRLLDNATKSIGIAGRGIMVDKMKELGMAFPKPTVDLAEIRREYHAAEREQRDG
jgi:hypothetical protein